MITTPNAALLHTKGQPSRTGSAEPQLTAADPSQDTGLCTRIRSESEALSLLRAAIPRHLLICGRPK